MNIEIKFDQTAQANEFASALKDKNLRGVKVKQTQSKPEDGSLDMAELLPLIKIVVESGFAAGVVTSVFELLRGLFIEKRKAKTEDETERLRIMGNENIERAKIEQQSNFVEFTLDDGNKKVNLKFYRGDEAEQAELLNIIREMKN
jgi:hypothetical protein